MPIYFRKSSTRIILHVSLPLDSALWGSITDRNCPIFNDFGADFLWGGNMFSKWLVEVAQMSINGKWLNRLKIIHIMEKLLSYKREWTTDACQELRQREEIRQKKKHYYSIPIKWTAKFIQLKHWLDVAKVWEEKRKDRKWISGAKWLYFRKMGKFWH